MATLKARYHASDATQGAPRDAKGRRSAGRGAPRAVKGWYVVFHDARRRPPSKEIPTGTKDERAARARLVEAERAFALGTFDPWTDAPPWKAAAGSGLTVADAAARFVESRAKEGSRAGADTYRYVLGAFVRSLPAGLMLVDLAPAHVARWLSAPAGRAVAPRTAAGYRARAGVFARWCVASQLVPAAWQPLAQAPASKAQRAAVEEAPKYYTAREVAQLVGAIRAAVEGAGERAAYFDRLLLDLVPFTFHTGLRRGEVVALRWGAVHLDTPAGSFVSVEPSEGFTPKSGRRRAVPLLGEALEVVRRRLAARREDAQPSDPVFPAQGVRARRGEPPKPVYGPALTRRLRLHARAAGLRSADVGSGRGRALHSLRHAFGTEAVSRGASLAAVQAAMGHSRAETTQVYAKMLPGGLHDELARAFASSSGAPGSTPGSASGVPAQASGPASGPGPVQGGEGGA